MNTLRIEGFFHGIPIQRSSVCGSDNDPNRDIVFPGKLEVPLIVGGNSHDGTGTVIHENVIGNPDRNLFSIYGIRRIGSGEDSLLFSSHGGSFDFALLSRFPYKVLNGMGMFGFLGKNLHQGMLRRKGQKGYSENRIETGGKGFYGSAVLQGEGETHAFGAAYPVLLHNPNPLGPSRKVFQIIQQLLGIIGGFEEPLFQGFFLHRRTAAPAVASVDNLLVGEHRGAVGAPVYRRMFSISQPLFEELQEDPLGPAIIVGIAGLHPATPIITASHTLELSRHMFDVLPGPLVRMHSVFNSGIFRREAESIETHGMKHVISLHPEISGQHVSYGIIPQVPHMEGTAGIGKHLEAIELFLVLV